MEVSTSSAAPTPSRIMVIGEGEINRLKQDLNDLSKLIVGLVEEFDELQDHLVGVSQAENPSITAKCWMTQARQLFYDTGDYLYDSMHSGKEFKIFKARAENASERVERLRIRPEKPSTPKVRRLPAPLGADLVDEVHKDKVDEVDSLIGTDKELKVVSIVGPEGVGKTTFAKGLYRRYIGRSANFQCWAFLRVSAKPDILRLLTSMFIQIQRKQPSNLLNAHQLIKSIATYLQDKRYFIIIDDIWTEDVWGIISRAFPGGDCCSRVITTTQIQVVALACCGHQSENVFKMEPLRASQSEKLFLRSVFGSESGCPGDLKDVSDGIIRRCGGLPLACINIASMLPNTLKLEEWKGVLDFLPSTWSKNPGSEWMKEVVTLMYSTLRPHLKTCLLCFSMYPEGWIVRKDDLVKQWVLEGFLDEGTEEIARGYFDELVRRGMIQPVITNKNSEVLSCTLHRIIHDVIVNKSMEENFIIMVDYSQSAIALPDKVRRLSVQFQGARSAHIPDNIVVSKVRSLAFFGLFQCLPSMDEYGLLRVLILHIWADQDTNFIIPEKKEDTEYFIDLSVISNLLRLRYLKIACNIAIKLPVEIQRQQYLEILEVDATLAAIPWDIGGLSELRILKFAVRELSSDDVSMLKELVALTALSVYVKSHAKTRPRKMIVLDEGGFLNLKLFTFRCRTPCLLIEEGAMPKIEKLGLCFSSNEARQDCTNRITIEHLPSLQEISVEIRGAVAAEGPALVAAFVWNNENNPPIVQLMESRQDQELGTPEEDDDTMEEDAYEYPGTQEEGSGERGNTEEEHDETQDDGSGKHEHNEANTRISMLTGLSSSLSVPVAAVGWGIATAGWILSPAFTRLVLKALSHMEPGEPNESFSKLVTRIIPQLKLTLEAAESSEDNVFFEQLVRELKSNFYELEEILDEVEYDRLESQFASAGPTNQGVTIESSQKSRMREILNKTEQALNKARDNIKPGKLPSNTSSQPRLEVKDRLNATCGVPRVQVIGREDHLKQITDLLHDTKDGVDLGSRRRSLSVIGIYGIAGSGKSTLAQHVYWCEKKTYHFDVFMWIHVSRNYTKADIIRDMLKQVGGGNMRETLKAELHMKKFLLVLDDIWCDEDSDKYELYELLSLLTQIAATGSKILVTSRNKNVISCIGHDVEHTSIEIPDLSEKDFCNLFMYHALGGNMIDAGVKETLEGIGAHIVKMLNGSPLAAALVGGILRKEMTIDHWISVKDDPYLLAGIMGILWLWYKHLDEQAKRCFAYCSIFPRRHRFERDDLVRLWVAEGFIEATDAGEMEEIGNYYFSEFVATSIFMQLGEKDSKGGKEYFLVHDLLHDIAEQVSGSDFFRIEDGWRGGVPLDDVRHLFVQTSYRFPMKDVVKLEKLRSLIILTVENSIGHEVLMDILENKVRLRKLRVLVVETACRISYWWKPYLPASVCDLKHIRYLAFRWRGGDRLNLPDAFNKLYNMQVLDFGDSNHMIAVAVGLGKLVNLRHLTLHGVFVGLDRLARLESLPFLQIRKLVSELTQLKDLQKLRGKLHIDGLENVESKEEALEAKLADKKRLTELVLEWDYLGYGKELETAVKLQVQADVLEGLCPWEHLEELQIIGYMGRRYPDWMLGDKYRRSWHVQRLVFKNCSALVTISGPFFSNLVRLTLEECNWSVLPYRMKNLEKLTVLIIYRCEKIRSLGGLPRSLKYLEICMCADDFMKFYKNDRTWNEMTKHIERKFIGYPRLQDSSEYPDEHGAFSRDVSLGGRYEKKEQLTGSGSSEITPKDPNQEKISHLLISGSSEIDEEKIQYVERKITGYPRLEDLSECPDYPPSPTPIGSTGAGKDEASPLISLIPSWKPPEQGTIKLNVNAGYRVENKDGTTGCVVRDHTGALLRAQAIWYECGFNPFVMEAQAILDGVYLAIRMGLHNVVLETDSLLLVNIWKELAFFLEKELGGTGTSDDMLVNICQEVNELSKVFASFVVNDVSQLANEAARSCAHKAGPESHRCVWINFTPPFLATILEKDCNPNL